MDSIKLNKILAAFCITGILMLVGSNAVDYFYGNVDHKVNVDNNAVANHSEGNPAQSELNNFDEEKIALLLKNADIKNGMKSIGKCTICHAFEKSGKNKTGPYLWNVVNRDIASVSGFNYSKAMSAMSGKWDYVHLFNYLKKPAKYVPGNKMAFVGIKNDEEIADIVMYLRSLSDHPAALPN